MRYAAKRTWPDRPKAWEQHGEAETLEAFALAFASDQGLGVGTEFEVLDKDSDDAAMASFRVESTLPYRLGPVAAEQPEQSDLAEQPQQPETDGPPPPPFVSSAIGFFFYMAKVAVITVVVLGGLFWLIKKYGT